MLLVEATVMKTISKICVVQ